MRVHTAVMQVYSSVLKEDPRDPRSLFHDCTAEHECFVALAIMILCMRVGLFNKVCLHAPRALCVALSHAIAVR
eukprot:8157705-Pyramimonas_sp.AAC.1